MNLRPSQTLGTPKLGILLEAGSGEQKTLCVEIMAVLVHVFRDHRGGSMNSRVLHLLLNDQKRKNNLQD